jgi:hypothetical protein
VYQFILDETNRNNDDGETFFIVGGLIFDEAQAVAVHRDIEAIRVAHKFSGNDQLKFQTAARPDHLTHEEYTEAKSQVIKSLRKHQVKMVVVVGINAITQGSGRKQQTEFSLNILAQRYYWFLQNMGTHGIFLFDRDDQQIKHLQKMFSVGTGREPLKNRIVLFGSTYNQASHLSSAVDIALGGIRHCVNHSPAEERPAQVASTLFGDLYPLLLKDGKGLARDRGFNMTPKNPRNPEYREMYDALNLKIGNLRPSPPVSQGV